MWIHHPVVRTPKYADSEADVHVDFGLQYSPAPLEESQRCSFPVLATTVRVYCDAGEQDEGRTGVRQAVVHDIYAAGDTENTKTTGLLRSQTTTANNPAG